MMTAKRYTATNIEWDIDHDADEAAGRSFVHLPESLNLIAPETLAEEEVKAWVYQYLTDRCGVDCVTFDLKEQGNAR